MTSTSPDTDVVVRHPATAPSAVSTLHIMPDGLSRIPGARPPALSYHVLLAICNARAQYLTHGHSIYCRDIARSIPAPGGSSAQVKWLDLSNNLRLLMFTRCYAHASAGKYDAARSRTVTMRRMAPGKAKRIAPGVAPRERGGASGYLSGVAPALRQWLTQMSYSGARVSGHRIGVNPCGPARMFPVSAPRRRPGGMPRAGPG
jgi:hypothetical protein